MKKPYISQYAEEYQLQNSILFYDHFTQLNYLDKEKTKKAISFVPPEKTIETRVIENNDVDEIYVGPNTTKETSTIEETDEDFYQFSGPQTTVITETIENADDEFLLGPQTTVITKTVENADNELLLGPPTTRQT